MYLGQQSKQQWSERAKIIASLFVSQETCEKAENHCKIAPPQPIYSSYGKENSQYFDLKANQIKYKSGCCPYAKCIEKCIDSLCWI